MENNNTPRKARLYYAGTSFPVLVDKEDVEPYLLILDWNKLVSEEGNFENVLRKRELYLDAMFGYEGAHIRYGETLASQQGLYLSKFGRDTALVFDEPDTVPEEGEPAKMTDLDNVVPLPLVHPLTELDKQLNLMAHLNYEVKSWDISFPEDGEPHLCVAFSKVEELHPF